MTKIDVNFLEPSQQQLNDLLEYYQTKQYDDAEKLSLSITQEFPKYQFAWKVLAVVLKLTGRISESLVASQKSVELDPQDAEAHNNLGSILQELEKLKDAMNCYKKAIELRPNFAQAHSNLGIILGLLKRLDEAEASYKKALSIDPTLKKTLVAYGNLLLKLNKHLDGLKFIDEGQGVIVFTESSFKII